MEWHPYSNTTIRYELFETDEKKLFAFLTYGQRKFLNNFNLIVEYKTLNEKTRKENERERKEKYEF